MNRIVRFKCNVAGASGVGKTTFLDVATTGRFNPSYSCTIGASMIPSKSTIRGETIMLNFLGHWRSRKVSGHCLYLFSGHGLLLIFLQRQ